MKTLRMPMQVYFSKSWTFSEIFGTLSYVRQWYETLFGILVQEKIEALPASHPAAAEAIDMVDTRDREWEDAFEPSDRPPARIYFVEMLIMSKNIQATITGNADFGGITFTGTCVSAIDRDTLVRRFGRHNSLEFSRTVGHEIAHILGLKHLERSRLPANIIHSEASSGRRPKFAVEPWQVDQARAFGLRKSYLKA